MLIVKKHGKSYQQWLEKNVSFPNGCDIKVKIIHFCSQKTGHALSELLKYWLYLINADGKIFFNKKLLGYKIEWKTSRSFGFNYTDQERKYS